MQIDGPDVRLTGEAANSLAMALHELATNAAKYGALSNAAGQVAIRWGHQEEGPVQRFRLEWQEFGRPTGGRTAAPRLPQPKPIGGLKTRESRRRSNAGL